MQSRMKFTLHYIFCFKYQKTWPYHEIQKYIFLSWLCIKHIITLHPYQTCQNTYSGKRFLWSLYYNSLILKLPKMFFLWNFVLVSVTFYTELAVGLWLVKYCLWADLRQMVEYKKVKIFLRHRKGKFKFSIDLWI